VRPLPLLQTAQSQPGAEPDRGPAPGSSSAFSPRLVGFLCNWCSYAAADQAGAAQLAMPPNVHFIRVLCTGRVDPQFVLAAFERGADGVLVLGCHPGDCHYKEQNYRMIQRHALVLRLLAQFGIRAERCVLDFVSAAEGERFARVVARTVESVRALGPLGLHGPGGSK
jgi:F420-non-reducing hydrogenase iron-sulfur subunit